jgi:hypothetical protein
MHPKEKCHSFLENNDTYCHFRGWCHLRGVILPPLSTSGGTRSRATVNRRQADFLVVTVSCIDKQPSYHSSLNPAERLK